MKLDIRFANEENNKNFLKEKVTESVVQRVRRGELKFAQLPYELRENNEVIKAAILSDPINFINGTNDLSLEEDYARTTDCYKSLLKNQSHELKQEIKEQFNFMANQIYASEQEKQPAAYARLRVWFNQTSHRLTNDLLTLRAETEGKNTTDSHASKI